MICQVARPDVALPCDAEESGGYRCERLDMPHEQHWIGEHTIQHALAGSGYDCDAVSAVYTDRWEDRWK